ncbi:MAG: hypothetical protein OEZ16_12640, partial [Chromatiales bacterium]|nr:hypothetical protein [Chromatiales bacterium]
MSDCCTPASGCCVPETPKENHQTHDTHRQSVRAAYAQVAQADNAGEGCGIGASCCGTTDDGAINTLISTRLGYSKAELDLVPSGA